MPTREELEERRKIRRRDREGGGAFELIAPAAPAPADIQPAGGVAIVMGSSERALVELGAALDLEPTARVVCVNDALRACLVPAYAFATLHPEKAKRFLGGLNLEGVHLFANERPSYCALPWRIVREKWSGTSGLFAVQIALEVLGFDRVILAGVPIDPAHGVSYAERRERPWANGSHARYQRGWRNFAASEFAPRVASMSGFTRELLGGPSRERAVTGDGLSLTR